MQFFGALMDWRGAQEPTCEALKGSKPVEQGVMHIRSITQVGGAIVGHRALDLEKIEPWLCVNGNVVQKGYNPVRAWRRSDDAELPDFSWWGWDVIWLTANKRFLGVTPPPDATPSA